MEKYQDWSKKDKAELLKLLKKQIEYYKVNKKFYICGSRVSNYYVDSSDIDMMVVVSFKDYWSDKKKKDRGEFRFKGKRCAWIVQKKKNVKGEERWRYWGKWHLPRVDMETGEYYEGKDLQRYIRERKSDRIKE